ncbi:MAG: acyl-ACP--UDP-N-acetylglucosamine O-acyltransferase [bacterium]
MTPASIHPTAVIDPSAVIGSGTTIGAYSVIGPGVTLGEGCVAHNHVSIAGHAKIGKGNEFYPFCSIGQRSQDLKYKEEPTYLEIGDHNSFREFVTVNRGTAPGSITRIGNHGTFLAYAHVAHDCTVGNHVIFSNNGTLGGHVLVGDHAVIGGLSGVHQFCRIGEHAIIGGCTKIVQDVPPFMIADGNPAEIRGVNMVGLERRGFSSDAIRELREAYKIIYRSNKNTAQSLEQLRDQFAKSETIGTLISFITSSDRGIVR